MAKRKCERIIKVSKANKEQLAKMFECSVRTVYQALCFEVETELARKIRHVARRDMGGWIEAAVPEVEIFYDTEVDGERIMRQYFENGAVLELSLSKPEYIVWFKGALVRQQTKAAVLVSEIPSLQAYARGLH